MPMDNYALTLKVKMWTAQVQSMLKKTTSQLLKLHESLVMTCISMESLVPVAEMTSDSLDMEEMMISFW